MACCDAVHRELNYVEGKILMITLDGQVTGLDANSGKELWKAKNADPEKGATMTGAGIVINDNFIVSVSGGEFGVRPRDGLQYQHRRARLARLQYGPGRRTLAGRQFQ